MPDHILVHKLAQHLSGGLGLRWPTVGALVVGLACGSVSDNDDAPIDAAVVTAADAIDASTSCSTSLVFVSAGDLYSANPDGSSVTKLTNGTGLNRNPSWSSDGAKIAFLSDREGSDGVFVMNADGTGVVRVSDLGEATNLPGWVPGGRRLSFLVNIVGTTGTLVTVNDDGSGRQTVISNVFAFVAPAWEPNGARVVYGDPLGEFPLRIVGADGGGAAPLTAFGGAAPRWSPGGGQIAYVGTDGIHSISPNGMADINLTSNSLETSTQPHWLSDEQLLFVRDVSGTGDLFVMNADGSEQINITTTTTKESGISVATDGSRVAFVRAMGTAQRIGVLDVDGTNEQMITTAENANSAQWRPCQ